jgi:hypothetical protein
MPVMCFMIFDVIAFGETLAAISSNLSVTLTPTLMFGAKTIAVCLPAAAMAALPASSKPVADNHFDAMRGTIVEMLQRPFRTCEVNQKFCVGQCLSQIRLNQHTGRFAQKYASIGTYCRGTGNIHAPASTMSVRVADRFNQHLSHAAGSARHRYF